MKFEHKLSLVALLGALAVIIGAFGAHFLKEKLNTTSLNSFKTGVQYHFIHTLATLLTLILMKLYPDKNLHWSFWFFVGGIAAFSGSIYLLSTRTLHNIELGAILGPLTPLGGLLFIIGWLSIARGFLKGSTAK